MRSARGASGPRPGACALPLAGLLASLFLVACGEEALPEGEELRIAVALPEEPIVFGRPFRLVVQRTWPRGTVPEAFDPARLAPLELVEREVRLGEDAERLGEWRVFDAVAFSRGPLEIPALEIRARPLAGGAPRSAVGDPLRLDVGSSLEGADPDRLERRATPRLADEGPLRLAAIVGATLLALAIAWRLAGRAPSDAERVRARAASAPARALEGLDALARRRVESDADRRAWHLELTDLLRGYLADRSRLHAVAMTREELRAEFDLRAWLDALAGPFEQLFSDCDRVKFAAVPSDARARTALLESARRIIEGTASRPLPPPLETQGGALRPLGSSSGGVERAS